MLGQDEAHGRGRLDDLLGLTSNDARSDDFLLFRRQCLWIEQNEGSRLTDGEWRTLRIVPGFLIEIRACTIECNERSEVARAS